MLKIKLSNNYKSNMIEVKFDDIKVSLDLTYISFVCDESYGIVDDDTLYFNFIYDKKVPLKSSVENFIAYGEIRIPTKYKVYTLNDERNTKYIKFSDNQYYYNHYELNDGELEGDNYIYCKGDRFEITNDYVYILEKYYVTDDNLITSDGFEYEVNVIKKFDEDEIVIYDVSFIPVNTETPLDVTNLTTYKIPRKFSTVKLYDLINTEIDVKSIVILEECEYITYKNKIFDVITKVDNNNELYKECYLDDFGLTGSSIYEDDEGNIFNIISQIVLNDDDKTCCNIEFRDKEYNLGKYLSLSFDNENIEIGDIIIASSTDNSNRRISLNTFDDKSFIIFNGDIYYENIETHYDFIKIGEEEYEIIYDDENETKGHITYNDEILDFNIAKLSQNELSTIYLPTVIQYTIDDVTLNYKKILIGEDEEITIGYFDETYNNATKRIITNVEDGKFFVAYRPINKVPLVVTNDYTYITSQPFYSVKRYSFIEILSKKFKVETGQTFYDEELSSYYGEKYIINDLKESYELKVVRIEGGKTFICSPIFSQNSLNYEDKQESDTIDGIYSEFNIENLINQEIYYNPNLFTFYKKNNVFSKIILDDYCCFNHRETYYNESFSIFKLSDEYTIPVSLDTNNANNLLQDDILENEFFNIESVNAINNIVDMERDLYYPVFLNGEVEENCILNGTFDEISKILINLHFRTRDLTTWETNEDNYQELKYKGVDVEDLDKGVNGTNWFCIDYYKKSTNTLFSSNEAISSACTKADLVGFLNFTSDDIFYQKSKVGKSFLKLLFYDSKNPSKQTLLYAATVWLDENKLYKTYINNIEYNSIDKNEINNYYYNIFDDFQKGEQIDVYSEPCNYPSTTSTTITPNFNDDMRLGCQFEILNRYETTNSSEGFYLHIFKNLSASLVEKDIYMKVQFNHAGEGKTLTFMMPTNENGELITKFTEDEINYLCEGCTINEIYDKMFIKVKIKFDINTNKYVWYLPQNLIDSEKGYNNGVMEFNLFEIKLKDESFIRT